MRNSTDGYKINASQSNISYIFEQVNYHKVYDIPDAALSGYADLKRGVPWLQGKDASHCIECGECEPKCPQNIEIQKNLKAARELLDPQDS